MLMESAPGLVNWQECNKLKRPGVHMLASLQAVALGSDTVQYFQWRKGRGSFEQYHGAVIDHLGTNDTRVFREVAGVGEALEKLSDIRGTLVKAKTAMLFDWDNMWAIDAMAGLSQETKEYAKTCIRMYRSLLRLGVDVDVIPSDDPLDDYEVVVAPMLYMLRPGAAESLKRFVLRGGQLLATYLTGYVDSNQLNYLGGFPGEGLSELFGVVSEEIDSLYPRERNRVDFADGTSAEVRDYAEVLRVADAGVLGTYGSDYYASSAAVTVKAHGDGKAYYVAARLDDGAMQRLFANMLKDAGIAVQELPEGVERHTREADGKRYVFYLNCSEETKKIDGVKGTDLLTGRPVDGVLELAKYQVAVIGGC